MSFSNNLKKVRFLITILNYNYALFVRNSLRKENLQIFHDMFTPLGLNYTHITCAATKHLDIPQRQTTRYGNTIENLECKISEFEKIIC